MYSSITLRRGSDADAAAAVADPFLPTAGVVALPRTWSAQIQVAA